MANLLGALRDTVKSSPVTRMVAGSVKGADTDEPIVAVTYDDGPDPIETPRILDVLAGHAAHATFFCLSRQAEAHPEVLRRMRAEGHEVALHGVDHRAMTRMSAREVHRSLRAGKRSLERIAGGPVELFRPPYGAQSKTSFSVARALRLQVVSWTATAGDWLDLPDEDRVARGLDELEPGGVLLLHDRYEPAPLDVVPEAPNVEIDRAALLDGILTRLDQRGWRAVTVSELLKGRRVAKALWYIDFSDVYPAPA